MPTHEPVVASFYSRHVLGLCVTLTLENAHPRTCVSTGVGSHGTQTVKVEQRSLNPSDWAGMRVFERESARARV